MIGQARSWQRAARRTILVVATFALTATAAEAQRRPSLVIGGPGMAGLLVPVGPRTGVRLDLMLQHNSSNNALGGGKATFVVVGLSTLHQLGQLDEALTLYVSPRVAMREIYEDDPIGDADQYQASVSVGFDGRITERLHVFAELGPHLTYQESSFTFGGVTDRSTSRSWSIANSVGVTIRF